MENTNTDYRRLSSKLRRISAGSFALALAAMQVTPAYATIDNNVTATGTAPGGVSVSVGVSPDPLIEAHVDVANADPRITLVKAATFETGDDVDGDGKGDPGDKITYRYTVTNSGNVTIKNISVADTHDGVVPLNPQVVPTSVNLPEAGSAPAGTLNDSSDATGDLVWDTLGPGDSITFVATYIVLIGDIQGAGGGVTPEGDLDNSATASGIYQNTSAGTTPPVSSTNATSVPLDVKNSITVTKTPNLDTNVTAGTTVTYTYVVTNDGNTPVSNIDLHDTHKGTLDALTPTFVEFNGGAASTSTNTGNHIDILQPGDTATYTVDYIVTQSDVDNLQ